MATDSRTESGVTFQEKDTVLNSNLSNINGYLPMVQDDVNMKLTLPQIKRDAVAVCNTEGATAAKAATVRNMKDFVLVSGITVTVYFANANAVDSPSLNINNTGSWPIVLENQAADVVIGSGCWGNGAILECKYVEVADDKKYWLLVGHNKAKVTSESTQLSDNTFVYNSNQVNSKLNNLDTLKLNTTNNLNNAIPSNSKYVEFWDSSTQPSNRPNQSINFYSGMTFKSESGYLSQIAYDINGGMYTRWYDNGLKYWKAWNKVYSEGSNLFSYAQLKSEVNIDTLLNNNVAKYYTQLVDETSSGTKPSGVTYGIVISFCWNSNYATQIFIEIDSTNRIYTRYNNDGTWTSWKKFTFG